MPTELNDTFYPILLSKIEAPVDAAEIDSYFQKLTALADAGIRKRERYVVIVTSDVHKTGAAVRRQVAEAQARCLTKQRNDVTLAAFLPVDNAFTRGIVTALRWLAPEMMQSVQVVPSLEVAVDEALRVLEANGTPFRGDRSALYRALGVQR